MSASPNAVLDQTQGALTAQLAAAQGQPAQDPAAILKQKQAAIEPDQAKISAAQTDLTQTPQPGAAKLPQAPSSQVVDPKDYQKLSWGLIAMGLIAGAHKGNWYAASHTLNGALKGFIEGNQSKADQAWKQFEADYTKAIEKHKEQEQDYEQTINNKKLTINQMLQELQWKAAKYDDQYTAALAQQKNLQQLYETVFGMTMQREKLELDKKNIASQIKARADKAAGGSSDPRIQGVYAAMSDAGISFPPGMRSVKAQQQTIQGLLAAHPDDSPQEIAARVKAGELGVKGSMTELTTVARREGSSAAAINALNREGGLYDQLVETAKKVDFGSAKFENNFRLWKQGKAVADPDISEYVNTLADTRAEFASVLARGGQVTDSVRIASEHAFPDSMSLPELQRNVERSKKIAESIQAGNTSVADAIINGKSLDEALKSSKTPAAPKPYADPAKEQRYQEWKRAHPDLQ